MFEKFAPTPGLYVLSLSLSRQRAIVCQIEWNVQGNKRNPVRQETVPPGDDSYRPA